MYFDDDFFNGRLIPRFPIFPVPSVPPGAPSVPGPGLMPGISPGASSPPGPPPSYTPVREPMFGPRAVDPGAIRNCLFRFTFIWLDNGQSFWTWLVFVGPRSAAGWRWTGRRWVFFGIDLRRIVFFTCT